MTSGNSPPKTGRRRYIAAVGAGAVTALAGCTGNSNDDSDTNTTTSDDDGGGGETTTTTASGDSGPDEVVIGANHPLSGGLSRAGDAMSKAVQLAAMHVNQGGVVPGFDDGGIPSLGGAELVVETGDNEGSQELGGEVEQQLIDAGAVSIIGTYSSPVTLSAVQIAEREQVPHVIDVSVANRILQERQLNYAFRVSPNARKFAQDYANFTPSLARENDQTYETAGLVYLDNAFGQSIAETLQEELPNNGVEVLFADAYSFGQSDLNTEATRAQDNDPDAVVFTGYGNGGIKLVNALQNVNYRPSLLTGCSTPTFTSEQVISEIGTYVNGGLGNNYDFDPNLDWTDTIFADYREEFGERLEVIHTSMSYTATIVVAKAIEAAGSADPTDIQSALTEIQVDEHPAAMGTVNFQDDGENENGLAPVLQVQNLEANIVYPEEYAESSPTF